MTILNMHFSELCSDKHAEESDTDVMHISDVLQDDLFNRMSLNVQVPIVSQKWLLPKLFQCESAKLQSFVSESVQCHLGYAAALPPWCFVHFLTLCVVVIFRSGMPSRSVTRDHLGGHSHLASSVAGLRQKKKIEGGVCVAFDAV